MTAEVTSEKILGALAAALGLLALLAGNDTLPARESGVIGALAVAKAIRADPEGILIIDIRDQVAWDDLHLPRAVHLPSHPPSEPRTPLAAPEWREQLERLGATQDQTIVIAGGPDSPTRTLWLELRKAGYEASYMPDMLADWLDTIISPTRAPTDDPEVLARWSELAELSRYFGGFPRVIAEPSVREGSVSERLGHARRRGCAI